MRAIVHDRYGPPEVLRLADVEQPVPKDDEILVRIHATTVNRSDCGWRTPHPFFSRIFTGLLRPKRPILGSELAGVVEAVGSGVTAFEVGDEVFGVKSGAHAEYVCAREGGAIAQKPAGMSFEEAAAVCDGAIIALTCLRKAGLQRGQSIVVYGASGSIGTAGVQLAKHFGARVTAVCNTKNVELVRSLGADEVVDYTREDFTRNGETYDIVFDAVGKHSFRRCRRSVKRGGVYVETDLGFMWHAPAARAADPVDRGEAGDDPDPEVHARGGRLPEGADRGRGVPRGDRPRLSAGGRGRGDAVRRDGAEDGQRRPDRRPTS